MSNKEEKLELELVLKLDGEELYSVPHTVYIERGDLLTALDIMSMSLKLIKQIEDDCRESNKNQHVVNIHIEGRSKETDQQLLDALQKVLARHIRTHRFI